MKLKLLIFLLSWVIKFFVLAQDKKCLHDGYLQDDGNCLCRQYNNQSLFTGTNCENRTVFNDGNLRTSSSSRFDSGCICPPGFLGANCEPTKCVTGNSQSFYLDPSDQSISFFITYNLDMANKTKNDDVVSAICDGFVNSGTKQLIFYTGQTPLSTILVRNPTSNQACINTFYEAVEEDCVDFNADGGEFSIPCPGSDSLSLSQVSNLLMSTLPNSELYLVTNLPLDINAADFNLLPSIIRKAISRKITIHVLAFNQPQIHDTTDYVVKPGYQALRTLAESTLGVFVTPYAGSFTETLLGSNSNSDAIKAMMELRQQNFRPAGVYSTSDVSLKPIYIPSREYYLSIRTEDAKYYSGSPLTFTKSPEGWSDDVEIDTAYWKLYKQKATSDQIAYALSNTISTPVDYVIYTKDSPTLFTGISNDLQNVDVYSPFAILGSDSQNLVGTESTMNKNVTSVNLYKPQYNYIKDVVGNSVLSQPITSRLCQFRFNFGSLTCTAQGVQILRATFNDGTISAAPFFCSTPDNSTLIKVNEQLESNDADEISVSDTNCANDDASKPLDELTPVKAFTIISRNVRYLTANNPPIATNYSTVDKLYYEPNNIFDYLFKLKLVAKLPYSYYMAQLVTTGTEESSNIEADNLEAFVNKVMDTTNSAITYNNTNDTETPINWLSALNSVVSRMADPIRGITYSDIFVIIDYDDYASLTSASYELFKSLYTTRSRIFFLTVDTLKLFTPQILESDPLQQLSIIAAQTGGGLYRLKDYDQLKDFFDVYFDLQRTGNGLLGADIVYQRLSNKRIPFFTTDAINFPEQLAENNVTYFLQLYGTNRPITINITCYNYRLNLDLSTAVIFGEQYRYDLKNVIGKTNCIISTTFAPPFAYGVSMVIYVSSANSLPQYGSLAFTDAITSTIDAQDGALLLFDKSTGQYPVLSTKYATISIKDSNFTEILPLTYTTNRSCVHFSSFLDFDFKCTLPNQYYYFYISFADIKTNITHSRMYVTQCLAGTSAECANGGVMIDEKCVCSPQYTGPICDIPVCLNGGIATSGGTCLCPHDFTGFFCENASGKTCSNVPRMPDIRSEVLSVIFVVERIGNISLEPLTLQFPGIQFSFIQYDCNTTVTKLISTDASKLDALWRNNSLSSNCLNALNTNTAEAALIQALDTQIGTRALLVLVSSGNFQFGEQKSELFNRLSSQRVDIRIFSQGISEDMKTLATLGNGIVTIGTISTDFNDYYTNYIWKIVPPSIQLNPTNTNQVSRLSVIETGNGECNVTIQSDIADKSATYFIHYNGGSLTTNPSCTNLKQIVSTDGRSNIWTCSGSDNPISIIGTVDNYSIEKMTTVQLGYGFQTSGFDEALQTGMVYGETEYVSFYTSQTLRDDYSTYPNVNVIPILMNGTLQETKTLPLTRKNRTLCQYTYFTTPLKCNDSVLGYVAKFTTNTLNNPSTQRTEQKIFVCATMPLLPIMRSFAFILDSKGGDPNVYETIKETVTNFLTGYEDNTQILILSQDGTTNFTTFVSKKDLKVNPALDYLTTMRFYTDDNSYADISPALSTIHQAGTPIQTSKYAEENIIFYLTQSGMVSIDVTAKSNVVIDGFVLKAVFFKGNVDKTVEYSTVQNQFGDENTIFASSVGEAVNYMTTATQNVPNTFAPPPTPRTIQNACVNQVQASIFAIFELTNNAGWTNQTLVRSLNDSYAQFFNLFPSDFELGDTYQYSVLYNITDKNGCYVNQSRFKGLTQMASTGFSGSKAVGGLSTVNLCYNNYAGIRPYINLPYNNQYNTSDLTRLGPYFNSLFSEPCKCSRLNDTNTAKIAVWLVYNKPSATDDANANTIIQGFTNNPYLHIVITFAYAANTTIGDFYYQLANFSLSNPLAPVPPGLTLDDFLINGNDITDMSVTVQKIHNTICKINGKQVTPAELPSGNMEYFRRYWAQNNINFMNNDNVDNFMQFSHNL